MQNSGYDSESGEIIPLERPHPPEQTRNLIFASSECADVFGALCEFQGNCEAPKKTKKATVKGQSRGGGTYDYSYDYAPLEEIHAVIRKPMQEAGLAYRQFLASRDGQWMMRTVVAHKSGQWLGCDYPIFQGRQEGAQGFASGVTYARRYGLMLALGIVAEDDDDANVADGNAATIAPKGPFSSTTKQTSSIDPADSAQKRWAHAAYKKVQEAIDNAQSFRELLDISGDHNLHPSPDWADMQKAVKAVESEQEAKLLIDRLKERIERKKKMLLGDRDRGI